MKNKLKKNEQIKSILRGHQHSVTSVMFYSENEVFSGDIVGEIIIWDLNVSRPKKRFKMHPETIINLHVLPSRKLITQGREGLLKCTDVETEKILFSTNSMKFTFCGFSCNNEIIVIPLDDYFPILNIRGKQIGKIKKPEEDKFGMVLTIKASKKYILLGFENGSISLYSGKMDFSFLRNIDNVLFKKPILSMSMYKNLLICSGASQKIVLMDIGENNENSKTVKTYELQKEGINKLCHDNNRVLITAGWDYRIRVFDLKRHKPLTILQFHKDIVNDLDILQCSEKRTWKICSASKDKRIVIWNLKFEKKKK